MTLTELLPYLKYNPSTGELSTECQNTKNKKIRKLVPDETNRLITTVNGYKLKIKADRLIWFITHGVLPAKSDVIFHKNLDETDNRLNNLVLLTSKEYSSIIEAMKNISGALKLLPHATDMFSYVLYYRLKGRLKSEVIQDITVAKKKLTRMQLKYVKLISKYTVSD